MNLDDLRVLVESSPLHVSLAVLAGLGLILAFTSRLRKMTEHRATLTVANILTIVAAALATMVSASGMWKFFTDILGASPLRIAFFAYIEVALFASALLARVRLLREPEKGSTGIDGVAVWVLAALTASLSALDAGSFREVCLRLVAPLVAAWMWERALAAERNARLSRTAARIHWTVTLERVFVWLRLAETHGRDVTEVDRARRRARLGRARLNLHLLQSKKDPAHWRLRRAHRKVIRQLMAAAEHIGLADFPDAADERQAVQMYMATLYGFVDATSPNSLAHLDAWRIIETPPVPIAVCDSGSSTVRTVSLPDLPAVNGHTDADGVPANGSACRHADVTDAVPHRAEQDDRAEFGAETASCDERGAPDGIPPDGIPPDGIPPDDDPLDGDADEQQADEASDPSSVAAMRRFWDAEVSKGRVPTGAELSRAAGVLPSTGLGRRKRREWESELPEHPRSVVGAGR
ncbi:hypothetical protein Daura_06325 [Dactylosporangium aurantiacum]|uniref:Uncharacterized protein n=1 Tax=Dactylosporangium aurantiacum TaxID=35754 RepID=A0A9Q9IGK9_9ACTN|nr:hypothetical protein [Dactylosporangium aurantiacum]MDG6108777.1 hypothetical protein [Dactylosporangium aurantiacum]UWZ55814.1 hypothetical protein Daura_06325 [Dactylosporangium aurantiacum]